MTIYYLSGPMTGLPDLNFPAFHEAARLLRAKGARVVNPAELNVEKPGWTSAMRVDIKALCDCDAIVLMPGWQRSDGANGELMVARLLRMPVYMLEELLA